MSAVPTVLDVTGSFFEPSHKYLSSAAMVLDSLDSYDDSTGEVDWVYHIYAHYNIDVADAYAMVANYIEQELNSSACNPPTWQEARTMIDILVDGRNWLLYTDSQGFVNAKCFETTAEAKDAFRIDDEAYAAWSSQDESEV